MIKRRFVDALFKACDITHFITLHRPWLWFFRHCPFATKAFELQDRWQLHN